MSGLWLLFVSLAVMGSFGYVIGMKLGTPTMNPFGFTFSMTVVVSALQLLIFLTARYVFKINVTEGLNTQSLRYALMSGVGAVFVDICYYLAVRYGSLIATQIFWTVGAIVVVALFSVLYFHETVSPMKLLGVAFGIVSVVLITKAP